MAGFVIEYNRRTRARRVTEFATSQEAVQYQLKLEDERTDRNIEIVALSADSLDTVKHTHTRYFPEEMLNPEFWGATVPANGHPALQARAVSVRSALAQISAVLADVVKSDGPTDRCSLFTDAGNRAEVTDEEPENVDRRGQAPAESERQR